MSKKNGMDTELNSSNNVIGMNAINAGSARNSKGNNNAGRQQAHRYHGKNHKGHKKQQKFEGENNELKDAGNDFDTSIIRELSSGKYKMKGRRAQVSINHLLQLQFPETRRNPEDQFRSRGKRQQDKGRNHNQHIHLHGDSFVNANYRVVANNRFSYEEQSKDPNVPVPHEKVVRIVVPRGQNCPICLSEEPSVPRMVICGHIFCLSCLLNFFDADTVTKNDGKRRFKECPLCGSILRSRKNFMPVTFGADPNQERPRIGEPCIFKLMFRPHKSMLPLPVEMGIDPTLLGDAPPIEMPHVAPYARIMTCSSAYALELLERDIGALRTQHEVDKALYNDDGKFYKMALEELNSGIAKILQDLDKDPVNNELPPLARLKLSPNLTSKYDESDVFFFFQTAFNSPTRYFLSPLDVKILLSNFGHYSHFPDELRAVVENVTYGTVVTEDLLSRYKYISHLPLGTEIAMVDLDWRSTDIISKGIYERFTPELEERRRRLELRRIREDKQKKMNDRKIEKEHMEFYQRENGDESIPGVVCDISDPVLDSLKLESNTHEDVHEVHETIWGTSIPMDEEASRENRQFEAILHQRMQQAYSDSEDSQRPNQKGKKDKKKKKKNKVMLFSNNHQTF